jgi:predicted PurR-regulated permease PerM
MDSKEVKIYSAFLIVIILLVLSYFIAKPYLAAVLLSAVLALVFYPIYKRILKYVKYTSASATITVIIASLVVVLPIAFFGFIVGREAMNLYHSGLLENVASFFTNLLTQDTFISKIVSGTLDKAFNFLADATSSFLLNIPSEVLQLVVIVFTMFNLLISGPAIADNIKKIIPFKNKDWLIETIKDNVNAIVYGFVIIAIIDFIVALVGLYLLGIPNYVLWAIVVAFTVLIPLLGPTLFWVPYSIVLFINGNIWIGVGMVVLGLLLSGIETFGRPYVIGKRVNIHPVAVLIGVLGGLPVFGIVGVIVGPVVLSVTFILIEELMRE